MGNKDVWSDIEEGFQATHLISWWVFVVFVFRCDPPTEFHQTKFWKSD